MTPQMMPSPVADSNIDNIDNTNITNSLTTRQGAKFPTRPRKNYQRTRNGCLTCRGRKKKCDERKPRCAACTRNKLACSWPDPPASANSTALADHADHADPCFSASSDTTVLPSPTADRSRTTTSISNTAPAPASESESGLLTPEPDQQLIPFYDDHLNEITWSEKHGSFTAPVRTLIKGGALAAEFLTHYISEMAPSFCDSRGALRTGALPRRPTLPDIMMLAYTDDLVMHCIIATGGLYLARDHPRRTGVLAVAEGHYACVLRGMRSGLQGLKPEDSNKVLRLLVVLMLMIKYESSTLSCYSGSTFSHIRASRQLIKWLLDPIYAPATAEGKRIFGYLLEDYTYTAIANSICPGGVMPARDIPFDSFLMSLSWLAEYDTRGMIIAGLDGLFELIPKVATLYTRIIAEQQQASASIAWTGPSPGALASYAGICTRLSTWQLPLDQQIPNDAQQLAMGEVFRHALWVYLLSAMNGTVPESFAPNHLHRQHNQQIAEANLTNRLTTSRYSYLLPWPVMIMGSTLIAPDIQAICYQTMREPPHDKVWCTLWGAELLKLLWEDDDPAVYGPYGLFLTMQKHNINLCAC